MYQQGYRYYCAIPVTGATANMMGEVTFGDADARSGNFAPICRTYTDQLRIYSKISTTASNVTVMVKSIIENIFEMDATPTSGSTNPITSGGVYTALAGKQNTITEPTLLKDNCGIKVYRWGQIVLVSVRDYNHGNTAVHDIFTGMPTIVAYVLGPLSNGSSQADGMIWIDPGYSKTVLRAQQLSMGSHWGTMVYITSDP